MNSKNNELISNEYYSLSELFATPNRKIIIPDFQRDYCWGDKTHGEKNNTDIVSEFLGTLIEEFASNKNKKDKDILLGKIDVYESPKNHIYLTDGQQRLTTLYLIIGLLYRIVQDEELKKKLKCCLISEFEEKQDDKEPFLQYAVRESTVFFLRDLVNEYFIKENSLKISDIQKQPWYFSEYDLDPSIISILLALEIIEEKLNLNKAIGIMEFSVFVINNIKIQYYDVKSKKDGEERFVIINTTGKSLTVSENIKPVLLGNMDNPMLAKDWEKRETWFWKNRKKEENIADKGVEDFLIWCFQIIDKQDEINPIKKAKGLLKARDNESYLKKIQTYFEALKLVIEYLKQERYQTQFKFINDNKEVISILDIRNLSKEKQQNILLPLLSFISKFENKEDECYQFLRRLRKNYFDQKWKERNRNYVDWRYVLQIIEKSDSIDKVLQFENKYFEQIGNIIIPESLWHNDEEKQKLQLTKHKQLLDKWEDHQDFMGDLSFLFKTSMIINEEFEIPEFNVESLIDVEKLKKTFTNYQSTIDLIRSEESAQSNPALANMFRLFRLFIGCNKTGHIYRTSWEFEGVLFSTLNRNHLLKVDFMKLLNSNDLHLHCTTFVKQRINKETIFDLAIFNVDKFIKAWLSLKVFHANEQNILLAFYDGYGTGVAAYKNKESNKLIDYEEFSLTNSICGFGVCSGGGGGNSVHTTGENLWCKLHIIDTPFSGISFEKRERTKYQILENQKTIDKIIEIIES